MRLARTSISDIIYLSFTENDCTILSFSGFACFVFIGLNSKSKRAIHFRSHYRPFATSPGPLLAIGGNNNSSLISSSS